MNSQSVATVCRTSIARKGLGACFLAIGYAVAWLMVWQTNGSAWCLVLQTYLQCLVPFMLFIGGMTLPCCAGRCDRFRAITAIALGTAPMLTWESQMDVPVPWLTVNGLLSIAATLLSVCMLCRMMSRRCYALNLPGCLRFLAELNYWLCLGVVIIPPVIILFNFYSVLYMDCFFRMTLLDILLALQSDIVFSTGAALSIVLATQAALCGSWAVLSYRRLNASQASPIASPQTDAIPEQQE